MYNISDWVRILAGAERFKARLPACFFPFMASNNNICAVPEQAIVVN